MRGEPGESELQDVRVAGRIWRNALALSVPDGQWLERSPYDSLDHGASMKGSRGWSGLV